jgi:hypothetical protein
MSDKTFVKHPKLFGKPADVVSVIPFNAKFIRLATRANITRHEFELSKVIEIVKDRGEEVIHDEAVVYAFGYFLGSYLNKFEIPLSEKDKVVCEVYAQVLTEGYKTKEWPKATIMECLGEAIEQEKIDTVHAVVLRKAINNNNFTDLFHKEL